MLLVKLIAELLIFILAICVLFQGLSLISAIGESIYNLIIWIKKQLKILKSRKEQF